jgi:hypothetical protein
VNPSATNYQVSYPEARDSEDMINEIALGLENMLSDRMLDADRETTRNLSRDLVREVYEALKKEPVL